MTRLFVGIGLEPPVANRMALLAGGLPGARWVEAVDLHVTLVFLGDMDGGLATELGLDLGLLRMPGFTLTFEGLGTFGRPKPHSLWAGVAPNPALNRLAAKGATTASLRGIAIERRAFTPHVTLARLSAQSLPRLPHVFAACTPFHGGSQTVTHFTLFQSHRTRDGAHYDALAHFPLMPEESEIPEENDAQT